MKIEHGAPAEVYALKKKWVYRGGSQINVYHTDHITGSKAAAEAIYREWTRNLSNFLWATVTLYKAVTDENTHEVIWSVILKTSVGGN